MNREHYRTPDREIEGHRTQLWQLCREALPSPEEQPSFVRLMNEASAKGLNWLEGLEYVVERRRSAGSMTSMDREAPPEVGVQR